MKPLLVSREDLYAAIRVIAAITSSTLSSNTRFEFLDPWVTRDLLNELAEEAKERLDTGRTNEE